jgi:3-oxoacyl-[acyl-carrier-protein] synthase-3
MDMAGIDPQGLDLIICATMQGDYVTPSLACTLQKELGAACPAFDINAACTGFVYGLDVAAGYFARGRAKHILLVAAECVSKHVDFTDRATCVLFGDGAGAVVLTPGDALLSTQLTASGNAEFLRIGGTQSQFPEASLPAIKQTIYMNGQEVYRFAVNAMCRDIKVVLSDAGYTMDDVRYVIAHQANRRILDTAADTLAIGPEKMVVTVDRYGNTSSASIPIALDELCRAGKIQRGDLLVFCAFGGGLTTGATLIRW